MQPGKQTFIITRCLKINRKRRCGQCGKIQDGIARSDEFKVVLPIHTYLGVTREGIRALDDNSSARDSGDCIIYNRRRDRSGVVSSSRKASLGVVGGAGFKDDI